MDEIRRILNVERGTTSSSPVGIGDDAHAKNHLHIQGNKGQDSGSSQTTLISLGRCLGKTCNVLLKLCSISTEMKKNCGKISISWKSRTSRHFWLPNLLWDLGRGRAECLELHGRMDGLTPRTARWMCPIWTFGSTWRSEQDGWAVFFLFIRMKVGNPLKLLLVLG